MAVPGGTTDVTGDANRSLSSSARSSRTSRPSSRVLLNVRYESAPSDCTSAIIAANRGSCSDAGDFRYSSRGIPFDSRHSSSRPEMSIPGPIHP